MQRLLAPDGCPWDRAQTLASLKSYLIEESYEVCEAIDRDDHAELCEELGDVLLQVVFQSEIARAKGWFGPDDVVAAICEKLERRHPHVFGEVVAETPEQVKDNWEKLKAEERGSARGVLDGVPASLPALLAATRVTEKAAQVGFDWPDARDARKKLDEELSELDRAIAAEDRAAIEDEIGDVLFTVVNVARKLGCNPEDALRATTRKFKDRFGHIERVVEARGKTLEQCSLEELDALWDEAKRGHAADR